MSPQPMNSATALSNAVLANAILNPPTAYPQITVGGVPYELRFSLTSSFHLETNCDIAAQDLASWMGDQIGKKHFSVLLITVTSAMLGHAHGDDWEPTPMLPKEFAAKINRPEWEICMNLYSEAISKAAAAVTAALTPPPQANSEPTPTNPVN